MSLSRDQWLYCLRVSLAVSIAYALAHGTDPSASLYAILGAGLVLGANVGEGIGISRDRMIGTVLGVLVGIPVAILAGTSAWAVAVACGVASIAGMLVGRTAVARVAITVAAVTILMHVADATHHGLFRLTNTAMGVAIAVAVSYLLWPITGYQHLRRGVATALWACAATARALSAGLRPAPTLQRDLFFALANLPKTLKEARQDPLRSRQTEELRNTAVGAVAIGTSVLATTTVVEDLAEEDRRMPWHRDLERAFAALSARLDAEAAELAESALQPALDRALPLLPHDAIVRLQSGPFSSEAARSAVQGMVRDLQQVDRRLASLRPDPVPVEAAP